MAGGLTPHPLPPDVGLGAETAMPPTLEVGGICVLPHLDANQKPFD